jgi:hypothetical protein
MVLEPRSNAAVIELLGNVALTFDTSDAPTPEFLVKPQRADSSKDHSIDQVAECIIVWPMPSSFRTKDMSWRSGGHRW